jgi:lysozyme family protein
MKTKAEIIGEVLAAEGGFVDHPDDSGGPTNLGITQDMARFYGFEGDMRDLTAEFAFDCYAAVYWYAVGADHLLVLSESVTAEVVDTAVNTGPHKAGQILQRSLNVLNLGGSLYADLSVDGAIGFRTLRALRLYLEHRDEAVLVKMLNALQGAFYVELAERREKDESFIYGWFNARINLC